MSTQYLVKKVQLTDTLKGLPLGVHSFKCTQIGSLAAVKAIASRLNRADESAEYSITTPDKGATVVITKNIRNNE